MKIAVIGSGISGLAAAYHLSKQYKVDLFEKDDHFGGHAYTYKIEKENLNVDLGFIVFNELTYPNLLNFFKELEVSYEKSNMSFAVSVADTKVEYGGTGFNAIFANRTNIFNFNFLKMLKEIVNFYKETSQLTEAVTNKFTLGSYLSSIQASAYFENYHIIPMVAAIWSMPYQQARELPLNLFVEFFNNHGLFKLKNRPQWFTVTGRSHTYVNKVLEKISGEYFKNYKVKSIIRSDENVRLVIDHHEQHLDYDHVVLATHADQSLQLLQTPSTQEQKILQEFTYLKNVAVLHTDPNLMPKSKNAWASWNALSNKEASQTCVSYWLNKLQNLNTEQNFFLTLNPIRAIEPKTIIKEVEFTHPFFNATNHQLKKDLASLQGYKRTWYCGSYFGYGFHEDGLKSALTLVKNFKA